MDPHTPRTSTSDDDDTQALDGSQTEAFQQRLQARLRELAIEVRGANVERTERQMATAPGSTDTAGDQGDQAEQRASQALRDAESLRDIDELREVEAALERVAAGRYGECVDCAVPIALRRLAVQPAAARCLMCQERHERAHPVAQRNSPWS